MAADTRDPTQPAGFMGDGTAETPTEGIVFEDTEKEETETYLSAIFFSNGRKIAVINDALLKEGDIVAGRRIERITANSVTLVVDDVIEELRLPPTSIKVTKQLKKEEIDMKKEAANE